MLLLFKFSSPFIKVLHRICTIFFISLGTSLVVLVETLIDSLFLELVAILASGVFITEELFNGSVCHRLLLRLLACHHLRDCILIFNIIAFVSVL